MDVAHTVTSLRPFPQGQRREGHGGFRVLARGILVIAAAGALAAVAAGPAAADDAATVPTPAVPVTTGAPGSTGVTVVKADPGAAKTSGTDPSSSTSSSSSTAGGSSTSAGSAGSGSGGSSTAPTTGSSASGTPTAGGQSTVPAAVDSGAAKPTPTTGADSSSPATTSNASNTSAPTSPPSDSATKTSTAAPAVLVLPTHDPDLGSGSTLVTPPRSDGAPTQVARPATRTGSVLPRGAPILPLPTPTPPMPAAIDQVLATVTPLVDKLAAELTRHGVTPVAAQLIQRLGDKLDAITPELLNVVAQLRAMHRLPPRVQALLNQLERLERAGGDAPTLAQVMERLHKVNAILSELKRHRLGGAQLHAVDGMTVSMFSLQPLAPLTAGQLPILFDQVDRAVISSDPVSAAVSASAATPAATQTHPDRPAAVQHHSGTGSRSPAQHEPPPLPAPGGLAAAGGASSAASGLAGAGLALFGLLAVASFFAPRTFDTRLRLAPARWRPVAFTALLERPG
jgi:hypothetical protein